MFRWPLALTPLSLGTDGVPQTATLEVTPRGAIFTLACLSHLGHPAHLALIDAYLKGQIRLTPTATLGDDSRTVLTSLAVPLLAANVYDVERLSLGDVVLLEREERPARQANRAPDGHPTFTPDSPRLLLRVHDSWHRVRGAERFEVTGCLGTRAVGMGDPWVHVVAALPDADEIESGARSGRWPAPAVAEVRAPSSDDRVQSPDLVARLRAGALRRFSRTDGRPTVTVDGLGTLAVTLTHTGPRRQPLRTILPWHGQEIGVSMVPELDGYQTLCLLPPVDAEPATLFEPMRDLAWETIEALIGRPLPERRTEPIALRLTAEGGRDTTLDVGASIVIVRNQTVFTCWVGSDGRIMLKLFPPGGMPVR